MVGSFEIHPLEKPKADSSNMLSNEDRINPNVSPIDDYGQWIKTHMKKLWLCGHIAVLGLKDIRR